MHVAAAVVVGSCFVVVGDILTLKPNRFRLRPFKETRISPKSIFKRKALALWRPYSNFGLHPRPQAPEIPNTDGPKNDNAIPYLSSYTVTYPDARIRLVSKAPLFNMTNLIRPQTQQPESPTALNSAFCLKANSFVVVVLLFSAYYPYEYSYRY